MATSKIKTPFVKKHFQLSNISADTYYKALTVDVALSGYTPIAVVNIQQNQAVGYSPSAYIDGTNAQLLICATNGNITSRSVQFDVLYI